jgi:hypothetical protein
VAKQWLPYRCLNCFGSLSIPSRGIRIIDIWFGVDELFFFFSLSPPRVLRLTLPNFKLALQFVSFRFGKKNLDYYLFYLKWFIKLDFFSQFHHSSTFFCHIKSLFYLLLFFYLGQFLKLIFFIQFHPSTLNWLGIGLLD